MPIGATRPNDRAVHDRDPGGRLEKALLQVPLDDVDDRDFWDRWDFEPPPIYYREFLCGEPDEGAELRALLARVGTSARELLLDLLSGLDAASYLRDAGVTEPDLAAIRDRLTNPPFRASRPPSSA